MNAPAFADAGGRAAGPPTVAVSAYPARPNVHSDAVLNAPVGPTNATDAVVNLLGSPSVACATRSVVTNGSLRDSTVEAITAAACEVCTCSSRFSLRRSRVHETQPIDAVTSVPTTKMTAARRTGLGPKPFGDS